MYSYWEKKYWFDNYDVTIIGSGIVGLSAAYYLKEKDPKLNIAVVERHGIPYGASTRNAGFACFGTVGEILSDLENIDEEEVNSIIKLRWDGLKKLRAIHGDAIIEYCKKPGIEVFSDKDSYEQCADNIDRINSIMYKAIGMKNVFNSGASELKSGLYKSAIINENEGQLNPVKLVKHLIEILRKQKTNIHNGLELDGYQNGNSAIELQFKNGLQIKTRKLVFCTNAFTNSLLPDLDIIPARNQVLVSEKMEGFKMKGCYHFEKGYVYFREVDSRLLIGGGRHIDMVKETTSAFGENENINDYLIEFASKNILKKPFKAEFQWSGIIATGASKQPIIKEIEKNVYAAVRLGGMGVAIGSELGYRVSSMLGEE